VTPLEFLFLAVALVIGWVFLSLFFLALFIAAASSRDATDL
jgi:hypothetical protein